MGAGASAQLPPRSEVEAWDAEKVSEYVSTLTPGDETAGAAFSAYAAALREKGVGGKAMLAFDEAKLAEVGVTDAAHVKLITERIASICAEAPPQAAEPAVAAPAALAAEEAVSRSSMNDIQLKRRPSQASDDQGFRAGSEKISRTTAVAAADDDDDGEAVEIEDMGDAATRTKQRYDADNIFRKLRRGADGHAHHGPLSLFVSPVKKAAGLVSNVVSGVKRRARRLSAMGMQMLGLGGGGEDGSAEAAAPDADADAAPAPAPAPAAEAAPVVKRPRRVSTLAASLDMPSAADAAAAKHVTANDFDVLRTLGEGGFGKVLLVRKKTSMPDGAAGGAESVVAAAAAAAATAAAAAAAPAHTLLYAMKVLNKKFIVESENVTRAVAEHDILSMIHHPFLVELHFAFQSEEHLFLVLNYVGGGELYELMESFHDFKKKGVPEDWARFYAAEIALALAHLHKHHIIYRDLKPENVMLGLDGHVCITDFGLAMDEDEEEGKTEIAGTPCYIPPDVLLDEGEPEEASDWWSFGIILYELLCGAPPFGAGRTTIEEIFHDIQFQQLKFPKGTPKNAQQFISKLLVRDPNKRLGSQHRNKDALLEIEQQSFFKVSEAGSLKPPPLAAAAHHPPPPTQICLLAHPMQKMDFEKLLKKQVTPPYIPTEMKGTDLEVADAFENDHFLTDDQTRGSPKPVGPMSAEAVDEARLTAGFTEFVAPSESEA